MTCHILRQLLTALEDLGLDYSTFRASPEGRLSTMVFHRDEDARAVAAAFGLEMRTMRDDTHTWLWAETDLDQVHVHIAGPMRPLAARLELVR